MPDFVQHPDLWSDRVAVQHALIETVPTYTRGTLAYHSHEYGWMLSEIMLQVDGRSLTDFFVYELADPLQLSALRFGLVGRKIDSLAFTYWLGTEREMVAGTNVVQNFEKQNTPTFLDAQNPATSLVCDAASLAAFYEFLLNGGKTPSGQRLLSEKIIKKYTSRQVAAWDRSLRAPLSVGRGFVVGSLLPSSFGWWNTAHCFGHVGGFFCLAFGDYHAQLSAAIVTNGNRAMKDVLKRFVPLAQGLRHACRR
jgi:CubicO group peptidase (beta-lactamase class C family)